MKEIRLYGVKIDGLTLEEAVESALWERGVPCFVVTPNAVMLDACRRNRAYADLLNGATLSLADGAGVLLAARRKGTPLRERVAGISFGEALLARAAEAGWRVFLLGGKEGVAEQAAQKLRTKHPTLLICGAHHGYFEKTGEEDQRVVEEILAARPDLLFVCFGFPIQEEWITAHLSQLKDVRVIAGLGGSLDVWAGNVKRAPSAVSRLGLEWAWRMANEPKRLCHLPAIMRVGLFGGWWEERVCLGEGSFWKKFSFPEPLPSKTFHTFL